MAFVFRLRFLKERSQIVVATAWAPVRCVCRREKLTSTSCTRPSAVRPSALARAPSAVAPVRVGACRRKLQATTSPSDVSASRLCASPLATGLIPCSWPKKRPRRTNCNLENIKKQRVPCVSLTVEKGGSGRFCRRRCAFEWRVRVRLCSWRVPFLPCTQYENSYRIPYCKCPCQLNR